MDRYRKHLLSAAALLCGALIYVYPLTLPTPLLDPDEGLHAAISQEMVESGDYLMPRFLGKPFLDKPILYFEAQAISLRCFGMNEAAVRLPGLLFGLLGAITTSLLARRLFDRTTGLVTLLVSLTSIVPLSVAQSAAHDVALVPWTNLILLCWWTATHENAWRRSIAYTIGAGLFVGLAVLTKGLIGVAVVFVGYALYVAISRRHISKFIVCSTTSVLAGFLLASPWFIAMEHRVPGYLYYYFVERHILGFATHTQRHGNEPWYFYVAPILGGTAPWILYAVPSLWQSWTVFRGGRVSASGPTLFVLCWFVGGLVFLSAAKSKLITYALPLYPAVAILAGHACKQWLEGELLPIANRACGWIFLVSCFVGSLAPPAILTALDHYNHENSPFTAYLAAAVATASMLLAMALMHLKQPFAALAMGALWFPFLFVMIMTWPMQKIAENQSQRQLALNIRSIVPFPDQVYLVGARVASLIFYLEPHQRQMLRPGQVLEVEADFISHWNTIPPKTLLAIPTRTRAHLPDATLMQHVHQFSTAGDYCVLRSAALIGNDRESQWESMR
jgi:4-amino-4-deoxy-L-arabinose transferase-like glycosyltransferase